MDKTKKPSKEKKIIEATSENYEQIACFLNQNNQIHRHLDWFGTLDWLGYQPYLLLMDNQKIQAVLCATPENPESAWIRTFVAKKRIALEETWQQLLGKAVQDLQERGIKQLAALALNPWFEGLLATSGFENSQNIIVMEWHGKFPKKEFNHPDLIIRPMNMDDISKVYEIDKLAFSSQWQNSIEGLIKAYEQTGISTIADYQGRIVGYQISTTMTIYGHLARLAVHPEFQRMGIAFTLVYNLLQQFDQQGFWRVTVNTQSDNYQSLGLYQQFGFERTGEEIPVYNLSI